MQHGSSHSGPRTAQLDKSERKRQLAATLRWAKGEAKKLQDGSYVCLWCKRRPIVPTLQMLQAHRAGKAHQAVAQQRRDATAERVQRQLNDRQKQTQELQHKAADNGSDAPLLARVQAAVSRVHKARPAGGSGGASGAGVGSVTRPYKRQRRARIDLASESPSRTLANAAQAPTAVTSVMLDAAAASWRNSRGDSVSSSSSSSSSSARFFAPHRLATMPTTATAPVSAQRAARYTHRHIPSKVKTASGAAVAVAASTHPPSVAKHVPVAIPTATQTAVQPRQDLVSPDQARRYKLAGWVRHGTHWYLPDGVEVDSDEEAPPTKCQCKPP